MKCKASVADEPVFPSEAGTPLNGRNLYSRYFVPAIEKARLRHFRIHDLGSHIRASLLIQAGASLAYVRDQLGHGSTQVTVDLYGHLVPSANVGWVDGLDGTEPVEQSATPAQQETEDENGDENEDNCEVIENDGGPGVSRTRDLRFRKPLLYPSELRGRSFDCISLQRCGRLLAVQELYMHQKPCQKPCSTAALHHAFLIPNAE
jgi:hypothetical protein